MTNQQDLIMSPREFKYGLLSLADRNDSALISDSVIARNIAAAYIDCSDETKRVLSNMLREDLMK